MKSFDGYFILPSQRAIFISNNEIKQLTKLSSSVLQSEKITERYRYELWKKCIQNNYQIDFVGQQYDDGTYPNFMGSPFDRDHEGIGGIESEGVLNNLEEVLLQTNQLDAVLLCIGGNDLLGGDDPQTVIDNIGLIIEEIQNRFPTSLFF